MKLFEMEVPEIYDGTVVIKNAVRAPGERAKVAVYSRERDVDPVGACVGMKGSRVQAIIRELRGEKIDIIEYSDDLVTFAQSALAPAKITRVSVKHEGDVPHLDVIVEDAQLSLAIGKRGQNVRLASELLSCKIDIKSESAVKDEVADALAALLHVGDAGEAPPATEVDLEAAPGIDAATAEALRGAGYADFAALQQASVAELGELGLSEQAAGELIEWATAQQAADAEEAGDLEFAARAEKATATKTMGDADFMAALSRAFQDLDVTRGQGAEESGSAESGAEAGAEAAATDGGGDLPPAEDKGE
jgi:transcription termination/antitermination protein NusA